MRHILILRELTPEEIQAVTSLAQDDSVKIIIDSSQTLSIRNLVPFTKLSEEEKSRINFNTLQEILEFGDANVDGLPVSRHLNFHGAGLWYYHKFRIYFKVRNQNFRIAEIESNLEGATSAIIFTSERWLKNSNLSLKKLEWTYGEKETKKESISWVALISYLITVFIRYSKSLLTPISRLANQKFLCIDTVGQYRNILKLDGSGLVFENAYLGYLFQKKGDQFGFLDQLLIPKFKGTDRFRFNAKALKNHNQRKRLFAERIIGRVLLSIFGFRAINRNRRELQLKYDLLKKAFEKDTSNNRILNELILLHNTSQFYLFKFAAYQRFFRKYKFQAILTTDENSPNFKIILDAAKQSGIKTVGYQHGSIHDLHPAYIYSKTDMKSPPVPDVTITWGNNWSKLLAANGNFKDKQIKIAGQIRTDVINSLKESELVKHHPILREANNKHIVLFATQPQRDPELRCRAAEDVVAASKNVENIHLVFKLHPREHDPEFYSTIAEEAGMKEFTISQDDELYILLQLADIVITCFSTVGSEALYFNKPLIILDHLRQDILNYHKDGVAFQATNTQELATVMQQIMDEELKVNQKRLTEYLTDSTYAIDGKVSERVWDYLNSGF